VILLTWHPYIRFDIILSSCQWRSLSPHAYVLHFLFFFPTTLSNNNGCAARKNPNRTYYVKKSIANDELVEQCRYAVLNSVEKHISLIRLFQEKVDTKETMKTLCDVLQALYPTSPRAERSVYCLTHPLCHPFLYSHFFPLNTVKYSLRMVTTPKCE
jgi:hypothetical protein